MPSLQTVGRRFENNMVRVDGLPFKGIVVPLEDSPPAPYDFTESRTIIRVPHISVVKTGDVVIDPAERKFLLADHDQNIVYDTISYRSHRAFPINKRVMWQREEDTVIDPLTGLSKGTGKVDLGEIDVLIELFGREDFDFAIKVREQTRRLVTGAPIQLNDIVNDMVVKRVDLALGVWVAEIE
jgi:hypothetical protein